MVARGTLAVGLVNAFEVATGRRHNRAERRSAATAAGLRLASGRDYEALRRQCLRYGSQCRASGREPMSALDFFMGATELPQAAPRPDDRRAPVEPISPNRPDTGPRAAQRARQIPSGAHGRMNTTQDIGAQPVL